MTSGDGDGDRGAATPAAPARYLERTRAYGWVRFLIEATIIALLMRIPVVWLGAPIVGTDARTAFDWLSEYGVFELAIIAIVIGPVLETMVAQWLPIALTMRLVARESLAVLLSAWIFGWLHVTQGALLVLIMFTTGLVLAWTFVVWRRSGLWQALAMTAAVHALLNTVALSAAMVASRVMPET